MNRTQALNKDNEIRVSIKELLWRLLEQWKAIVVAALIVALAFSCLMYVRKARAYDSTADQETEQMTQEDIIAGLNPDDREAVLSVLKVRNACSRARYYLSDSVLMNLDPYNAGKLVMTWYVDTEDGNKTPLLLAYRQEMESAAVADAINDAWGKPYDSGQVEDLVNVNVDDPMTEADDIESNILEVTVYIPEGNDAKLAEEAVKSCLPAIKSNLSKRFDKYDLKALTSTYQVAFDSALSDKQYAVYGRLYNLKNQLVYLEGQLSSDQKGTYEAIAALNPEEEILPDEEQEEVKPQIHFLSKRNLAAGLILGFFLYCFVYFLYFAFSGRIFCPAAIREPFGLRTLGQWHSNEKGGALGALLRSGHVYRAHHKGNLDLESETDKVKETIVSELSDKNDAKLLVVSNGEPGGSSRTFMTALMAKLKESGVDASETYTEVSGGKTLNESLLKANDAVMLLVNEHSSGLKDVREICEKCSYCDIPLLGAVYIS